MKPIRLTIAGLNSFREKQEIDFTKLTELGMFGIFGPTGSGKSSILDAITLALYGNVVRAGHNTKGILNQAEKKLEITFDFEIGSAANRKRYRIERVYKKGTGEFSVANQASRLLLLESMGEGNDYGLVMVSEGQRDVNQAILGIVGLQQDDFTRAVVLPQGKFAEFLQLTGSRRNEMTERLFGLEKYGQSLVKRASEWAKEASTEKRTLTAQQSELGDASERAVLDAAKTVEEAKARLSKAAKDLDEVRGRFKELEQIYNLMTQFNSAQAELSGLESHAGEIQIVHQSLERHGQATTVWPLVKTWKDAETAVQDAKVALEAAHAAEQAAKTGLDTAIQARDRAKEQRTQREPQLMVRKGQLQEAETVESALKQSKGELQDATTALSSARQKYREAVTNRNRLQGEVERFERNKEAALQDVARHTISPQTRQQLTDLRAAYQTWRSALKVAVGEQEKLTHRQGQLSGAKAEVEKWLQTEQHLMSEEERLNLQMEQWNAQAPTMEPETLVSLHQWQVRIEAKMESLRGAERDVRAWRKRTEEAEKAYKNQEEQLNALRTSAAQAETVWRSLQDEYQKYEETNEAGWIARLQSRLQEGEPCPVCGAHNHPHTLRGSGHEPVVSTQADWSTEQMEALKAAEQAWQEKKDAVHAAEMALAQAATTLNLANQDTAEKEEQLTGALNELTELWDPEVPLLMSASRPNTYAEWQSFILDFKHARETAQQEYQKWEKGLKELRDEAVNLKEKLRDAGHQLGIAQNNQRTASDEVTKQQLEWGGATTAKEAADKDLQQAMRKLSLPVEAITTETKVASMIRSRLEQASEDDRLANAAQHAVQGLEEKLTTARGQLSQLKDEVQLANQDVTKTELQVQQLERAMNERLEKLQGYTGGISVAAAMQHLDHELAALKEASERTEKAAQDATNRYNELRQISLKAATTQEEKAGVLQQQQTKLMEALADTRFATVEAAEDALLNDSEVEERTKTVNEYKDAVAQSKHRCSDLEKQLSGQSVDEETMANIKQAVKSSEAEHQLAVETHGISKMNYDQLLERKERWEELEKQRLASEALEARLSVITKALRGNAFVQYVAKEQMEVVARQASNRLKGLTRNRYALTFGEDGEFLMRDDHNGGSTRPVNTLSGGETFLTSLSLALALSAHIQLRGQHPLEFFFLDEGFGTLDPDLLDVVVSSLERLNLDRMSIGLISHVPELRQRMQRRLIVEPALPAGRGTQVRVEMA